MSIIPPSFKLLTSATRRAEELEKDPSPEGKIVGYYCRYYVVSKGAKMCSNPPLAAETAFLSSQMDIMEKSKPKLNIVPGKGEEICRTYALSVFEKADDEDRAGVADKGTAKMFYAAGTFFDILEQFGGLAAEVVEKRKYSKWKATEILNAIKNGEKPAPGGFREGIADLHLGDDDEGEKSGGIPAAPTRSLSSASGSGYSNAPMDIPSAPRFSNTPPISQSSPVPPPFQAFVPAPTAPPVPIVASVPSPVTPGGMNSYYAQQPPQPHFTRPPVNNTDPRAQDAVEICQYAILAIKKNDFTLAKERLKEALRRLE